MSNFYTSDTHWNHKNIASKNGSAWKSGYRTFTDLWAHNEAIVKNINTLVKEDDVLWHLGDWSFGGLESIWNFRKQLRCKTIHVVLGNHDDHIRNNKLLPHLAETGRLFTAKSIFTSVQEKAFINIGGVPATLDHYAHRVWEGSHKGFLHLYAHSHNTLEYEQWGKSMDVGIDAAYARYGEYRPFTEEEILAILATRPVKFLDHHDAKTNVK